MRTIKELNYHWGVENTRCCSKILHLLLDWAPLSTGEESQVLSIALWPTRWDILQIFLEFLSTSDRKQSVGFLCPFIVTHSFVLALEMHSRSLIMCLTLQTQRWMRHSATLEELMGKRRRQKSSWTIRAKDRKPCNKDTYSVMARGERRTIINAIREARDGLPVEVMLDFSPGTNPSRNWGWKEMTDWEKNRLRAEQWVCVWATEEIWGTQDRPDQTISPQTS